MYLVELDLQLKRSAPTFFVHPPASQNLLFIVKSFLSFSTLTKDGDRGSHIVVKSDIGKIVRRAQGVL